MQRAKTPADKFNMRQTILDLPKQFGVGLKSAQGLEIKEGLSGILICGVGGSALPGDILKMWFKNNNISFPVHIHKDYGLPNYIKENSLIICVSYSGLTEEPLSSLEEAQKRNLKIAAITSGGKLGAICREKGIPLAKVPSGLQPRMALGYQFSALAQILANCLVIKKDGLEEIAELEKTLQPKSLETRGKKLAKKLKNKIPLVYASFKNKELARIWKIKFNENSKVPSFYNYFPELNHNEMTGFSGEKPGISGERFSVILLRDSTDNARNLKRLNLTSQILRKNGLGTDIVDLEGEKANRESFESVLKKKNPDLVFLNGHGSPDAVCGQDDKVVVQADLNEKILAKRLIYAVSCDSAQILGKEAVRNGAKVYIGYNKPFAFLANSGH